MKLKPFLVTLSVVLNVCFIFIILYLLLQGTSEIRYGRYGTLKNNLEIGRFGESTKIFTLPKGLIVREASATGADWFEPNRFRIVVTSDRDNLVDYSIDQNKAETTHGEYYSAVLRK